MEVRQATRAYAKPVEQWDADLAAVVRCLSESKLACAAAAHAVAGTSTCTTSQRVGDHAEAVLPS